MKALFITLLTVISFSSYSQFRNVTWGMSIERVKQLENHVIEKNWPNELKYKIPTDDMNCILTYNFNNNKLVEASYYFTPLEIYNNRNTEKYVWSRTTKALTEKYGNPIKVDENKQMIWDLPQFTIRALNLENTDSYVDDNQKVSVTYYPPIKDQKSIL
ncbi:hypothetical protein ACFQ2C_16430 [Sphingobacterium daejeonense]|uniref:Uncharacterized protein n=1 Tax=Sphingobacterium daejeonense TaxID=371142 RepID=A0ABW3RQV4_9SPHI